MAPQILVTKEFKPRRSKMQIHLIFAIVGIATVHCDMLDETTLIETLLSNYGPVIVKPDAADGSSVLNVKLSFSLFGISVVDMGRGILETVGYLFLSWKDPRLVFPQGSGVDYLEVEVSQIWRPDIEPFPFVAGNGMQFLNRQNAAIVLSDGEVWWFPYVSIWIPCDIQETGPFNCSLKFGSWTYDSTGMIVELGHPQLGLKNYNPTPYVVTDSQAENGLEYYDFFTEPFAQVKYTFTVSPKP